MAICYKIVVHKFIQTDGIEMAPLDYIMQRFRRDAKDSSLYTTELNFVLRPGRAVYTSKLFHLFVQKRLQL